MTTAWPGWVPQWTEGEEEHVQGELSGQHPPTRPLTKRLLSIYCAPGPILVAENQPRQDIVPTVRELMSYVGEGQWTSKELTQCECRSNGDG